MVADPGVVIYGDDCDDCVGSRSYLEQHGVAYGERDIVLEPLSEEELIDLAQAVDGIEELAAPEIRDDVTEMEEDEIAEFLAADVTRLAHPIITNGDQVFVGYDSRVRDVFAEAP